MHSHYSQAALITLILLLFSCTTISPPDTRLETANRLADDAGFNYILRSGNAFNISSWQRLSSQTQRKNFIIYFEGDGKAWQSYTKISADPSPEYPLALALAAQDNRANIIYLSRPCQFIKKKSGPACQKKYWSSHRYAQEVITAYNEILDTIKTTYQVQTFELTGFSGGGLIASLLAAQRSDIVKLTTIAANLDHSRWTAHHHVSPLSGSLQLYSFINELSTIKQVHLSGDKDTIVPLSVNKPILDILTKADDTYSIVYKDYDHSCCWVKNWHSILHSSANTIENSSLNDNL